MDDPIMLHAYFVAGGPIASVAGLAWWLSGRFRSIERAYTASLAAHEDKDQTRHEENLERFGDIRAEIAGGMRRGNGDGRHSNA
jgi:hypothetical protein